MPFALARYWDSLESADYVEPQKVPDTKDLDRGQQEWLSELSFATEHECQSILYAKSLLDDEGERAVPTQQKLEGTVPQRIAVGFKCQSMSTSTVDLVPPPKPQRRIARLKNSKNETVGQQAHSMPTYSTLDLIESCKFSDNYANIDTNTKMASQSTFNLHSETTSPLSKSQNWTPPGFRCRADSTLLNISGSTSSLCGSPKPPPPKYEQLGVRLERDGHSKVVVNRRQQGLRHTIAVNQEDVEKARSNYSRVETSRIPPSSPKSMASDSTLSVDSGQCSGDMPIFSCSREDKDNLESGSMFHSHHQSSLPGYARMASTMDHVLRTSSALYTLLSGPFSESTSRDLVTKATVFTHIVESSPCSPFLPKQDLSTVKQQISEMQMTSSETGKPIQITNQFTIIVRKTVEQVLQIFAKIICKYLADCGNKDRLVVIALEHLIHIALFGDELCLESVQAEGLNSVLKLVQQPSTPTDTSRLLLRLLAVLCGVSKGCLSLLSADGLATILHHLCSTSVSSSIEAAGVLTQLTNPQHSFVQLNNVERILRRLLELVDFCSSGESLLLVSAAISNVSLQDPAAVDILYRQNSITRLIQAYNKQDCSTIFVQEQIVTILSRLAARKYEEALVAQGAVPMLLEMLTVTDSIHSDYCRRIRYKAAVCVGTLAATGIGLKALYNHEAYAILCHVLEMENCSSNPLNMICTNIRNKLESKYQIESAV